MFWILVAIALGKLAGIQSADEKRLKPYSTARAETEIFYHFKDKLHFPDASAYCESLEGEIFPKSIDEIAFRKLRLMKTVFWTWASSTTDNDDKKKRKICRIVRPMETALGKMNVSCERHPYPFLCRIPISGSNNNLCGSGYMTLLSGACLDIDECEDGTKCLGYQSVCQNLPGTFRCTCPDGMQGDGLQYCGYLLRFSQAVSSDTIASAAKSNSRVSNRLNENRLLRAVGFNFISKVVFRSVANRRNISERVVLYYDVYAKVKQFGINRFRRRIKLLQDGEDEEFSWLKNWGPPVPYSKGCLQYVLRTPTLSITFPKSPPGETVYSRNKCPRSGDAMAEVKCAIRESDGFNISYFDYGTLQMTNCSMKAMDSVVTEAVIPEETTSKNITTQAPIVYQNTTMYEDIREETTKSEIKTTTIVYEPNTTMYEDIRGETTTSEIKTVKERQTAASLEDMLGEFVRALKLNATFRASAEANSFGRTLLQDSVARIEADDHAKVSTEVMGLATIMLDWLVENPGSIPSSRQQNTDLIFAFEKLPTRLQLKDESYYALDTELISLQVKQVDVKSENDVEFFASTSNVATTNIPTKAYLPVDMKEIMNDTSNSTNHFKAGFLIYKNTSLFSVEAPEFKGAEVPQVLSVSVSGGPIKNLSQPLWYQMTTNNDKERRRVFRYFKCGFLNETTKMWSTHGCQYIPNSNPPNCTCNHLTNFGLLVKNVAMLDEFSLGIFGKVACSISAIALIWTLGCYVSSRNLRRLQVNKLHMHLCFSLLVSYLVFLLGVERTENKEGCMCVTAILHFFLLSAWGWMTVEAVTMYRKLVTVFGHTKTNYITKCAVVVYGVSLVIVLLTIFITVYEFDKKQVMDWQSDLQNHDLFNSYYVSERLCWLRDIPLFVSFLLPVAICLVICYICFSRITKALTCDRGKLRSSRRSSKVTEIRSSLIRSSAMCAVMGLTWIFAVPLAISDEPTSSLVFSWLFSAFNALQGFVIFIFFCAMRKEVRDTWLSGIKSVVSIHSRKTGDIPSFSMSNKTFALTDTNKASGSLAASNIFVVQK